jgi:hypothetical protein
VFSICNTATTGKNFPVTTKCPNVSSKVPPAVQGTSLGNLVTWSNLKEGWYCATVSGSTVSLTISGTQNTMDNAGTVTGTMASSQPTCSDGAKAGDYIQVNVTATYHPPFGSLSIVTNLGGTTLNESSWMRVN